MCIVETPLPVMSSEAIYTDVVVRQWCPTWYCAGNYLDGLIEALNTRLNNFKALKYNTSVTKSATTPIHSKEGDFEYRRSLVRKISLATKSEALKKWIKSLQSYDKYTVEALQELEYLVHQYETASDFVKLGGLELILPVIDHEDPSLASTALSVLSSALQG
ncbi:hypothetical protein TNCV_4642441 [Trichonephila clavipes]|nr:hypothetical protein TNCV_4642441 [Trichonephila clavipes]